MTDVPPTLVVLAAGLSSRYGAAGTGAGAGASKQLDGMGPGDETLMDYSMYDAHRYGFGRALLVIRAEDEAEIQRRVDRLRKLMPVDYVHQRLDDLPSEFEASPSRIKPWGTAHAVLSTERRIKEPFLLINADDFYGASSFALAHSHLSAVPDTPNAPFAFVGFKLSVNLSVHGGVTRGVCRCDSEGYLQEITEMTNVREQGGIITGSYPSGATRTFTGNEIFSANMWAFTPAVFPLLRSSLIDFLNDNTASTSAEFLLPEAVNQIIAKGQARFKLLPAREPCFGVTYSKDKAVVQRRIRALVDNGEYPANLFPPLPPAPSSLLPPN